MSSTVWILGDQLLHEHPAINAAGNPSEFRVLLIESEAALHRRPYGLPKLALLLSAMRHHAGDLEHRGYQVDYVRSPSFLDGLRRHVAEHDPVRLITMAASSHRGRAFQNRLDDLLGRPVEVLPNTQFLTGRLNPIPNPEPDRRYVMENFYRAMRRHFNVLMDGDQPAGGRWNFDADNRKTLPKVISLPDDAKFEPDEITRGVLAELSSTADDGQRTFDHSASPVSLAGGRWPSYATTRTDALQVFKRFLSERLVNFGPYEDAMTVRSHSLFHSVLSPYLNIGLLEPLELVRAAEEAYRDGRAPINSVEGFIRQILGWREFMYWQYWRQGPSLLAQNAWQATRSLPDFFWTGDTDMACLRHALERALATGYNHHIERLMLLSNFLMLAGVDPAEANEWFLSVYIDAYDWVMAPNVIGMGLNADDGLTATKPYIASANYINKMSDHCAGCRFKHKKRTGDDACPFNYLYWNFLLLHEEKLRGNPRFGPAVLGLNRIDSAEREIVQREAGQFLQEFERFPR
jgi:deoxyribodipyrimidine photolyase-related protein